MGLFNDENERVRKQKLKELEDKRLRFAESMQRGGFAPERMLLVSTERGGFVGFCRDGKGMCLIVGPDFGSDDDFALERYDALVTRREDFFQPAEGLGGAFGFGRKGAVGFHLIVDRGGVELAVPFIVNQNSAMICGKRNPLLSVKRRRGDANLVWDMQPMDKRLLEKAERELRAILEGEIR